jgi:hypothetical protein
MEYVDLVSLAEHSYKVRKCAPLLSWSRAALCILSALTTTSSEKTTVQSSQAIQHHKKYQIRWIVVLLSMGALLLCEKIASGDTGSAKWCKK